MSMPADAERCLREAAAHHRAGEFAAAERLYRDALRVLPSNGLVLAYLGQLLLQTSRAKEAEAVLAEAAALAPETGAIHGLLATARHEQGKLELAIDGYREAIRWDPRSFEWRFNLANAVADCGRWSDAADAYRAAIEAHPDSADAWTNLGIALCRSGRSQDALDAFDRALSLDGKNEAALLNKAGLLRARSRWDDAERCLRSAVEARPRSAEARRRLGLFLLDQRRHPEALAELETASQLRPRDSATATDLACAYREIGREEDAARMYREILARDPGYSLAMKNLATTAALLDDPDEARACYRKLDAAEPRGSVWRFLADCGVAPVIFDREEQIHAYRADLEAALERYEGVKLTDDWRDLFSAGCMPPFTLDQQGMNDRGLKERFARIVARSMPTPADERLPGKRRVGFLVTQGHEGVFLRSFAGCLRQVGLNAFRPVAIASTAGAKRIESWLDPTRFELRAMPSEMEEAVAFLRGLELDLLFFWEIGTDPWSYLLPFLRLAPIQATGFGIQTTSGIATVDWYLSSDLLEPQDAPRHYSERLFLGEHLPAYVERPPIPAETPDFGLPASAHVYLCPHRLSKVHPAFDDVVASILRRDPAGRVVFTAGRPRTVRERLERRLAASAPDVAGRIDFLPEPRGETYYQWLRRADVVLDTLHYGGVNTTYDALAMHRVVVTLPGPYQRARYAAGCYRVLQMQDPIAADLDDYVDRAVRFASDPDLRRSLEDRLAREGDVLFRNPGVARDLERFVETALATFQQGDRP